LFAINHFSVNVAGTRFVIEACLSCGVTQLVYTSTASVVIDGSNIQNGDEASLPYPSNARKYLDQYSASKAQAERLVIAANGILNGTFILC
jgi:sterol-4alpha-carboxylate 3-dehydrogenase (decarboxylating)